MYSSREDERSPQRFPHDDPPRLSALETKFLFEIRLALLDCFFSVASFFFVSESSSASRFFAASSSLFLAAWCASSSFCSFSEATCAAFSASSDTVVQARR